MKLIYSSLRAFALMAAVFIMPASAQEITPVQRSQIETIIHNYLLEHPEVLLDAMRVLETRQQAADEASAKKAVATLTRELFDDPGSPVAGNPKGDVTIVEFFDFRCPVCKKIHPVLSDVVKADGNIRVVYKQWPILGPESEYAARVALAARYQGKYLALHEALVATETKLSSDEVMRIAGKVGLDRQRLIKDMERPEIQQDLMKSFMLADELKINGTPSYVIGDQLVKGGRDAASFRSIIAEARKKS
jgi:protein-disulfide isomerase